MFLQQIMIRLNVIRRELRYQREDLHFIRQMVFFSRFFLQTVDVHTPSKLDYYGA
jgi:hypothetical protein